ncbi:hypothetical protein NY588_12740 [Curtobacterium flaccumfaciens pv. beticola]|uniref:DUF6507 family protein n=1 Tax=Curtobacterium TaxID=2034 RepID=UPI0015812E6C|nr:hypothetical protein [Curtobacterium sp. Csp2]MCS5487985.1 hypothetical protein [Curtobacterium flaccumfaciens pv. basellae]QKS15187.1 hypothetical protein HUN59_02300 [Curtobacterium sp. Csp2]
MADRLLVDLTGLGELQQDLTTVHSTLEQAHKRVDASDDEIGSGTVQSALHDFDHRWGDKRDKISESAKALADMLGSSVQTYTETDAQLAHALQVNDENGGGGPAAARAQ